MSETTPEAANPADSTGGPYAVTDRVGNEATFASATDPALAPVPEHRDAPVDSPTWPAANTGDTAQAPAPGAAQDVNAGPVTAPAVDTSNVAGVDSVPQETVPVPPPTLDEVSASIDEALAKLNDVKGVLDAHKGDIEKLVAGVEYVVTEFPKVLASLESHPLFRTFAKFL